MPIVTGNLRDFATRSLNPYSPVVAFIPNGPGVLGPTVFASQTITVVPEPSTSAFSVILADTTMARPDVWYTLEVRWLDTAGNYVFVDRFPWKLRVPSEGGQVGDLIAAPANPFQAWVSTSPPDNPAPGTWWLNPETGDLSEWN